MELTRPQYINNIVKINKTIHLESGEIVHLYSFSQDLSLDEKKDFAKHILHHFISEKEIEDGIQITKKLDMIILKN